MSDIPKNVVTVNNMAGRLVDAIWMMILFDALKQWGGCSARDAFGYALHCLARIHKVPQCVLWGEPQHEA